MRIRTKICGITNLNDAQVAISAGADALGFVFYEPSPRYVTADTASAIISRLPPFVSTVGLFVDEVPDTVKKIITQTSLDCLQFHGNEAADYCQSFDRPYYKAVRVKDDTDILNFQQQYKDAGALLLDTYVKGKPGGTGEKFNWNKIPSNLDKPFILAGGLTADNIVEAIQSSHPYAVDVSGGVEKSPGIKSEPEINRFMANVNSLLSF